MTDQMDPMLLVTESAIVSSLLRGVFMVFLLYHESARIQG
jgi:hypothetical protein